MISIIIPTRNRAALLDRLLVSLAELDFDQWEAIVVDDGSTDETPLVVERFRRRSVPITYLYQPWRKIGAARNLGLAHARGEIVAFTDDDCTVTPGWLDAIAAAFDAHPEALGVQGKTITDRAAMTPFTRQIEQLEGGQPYRTCNIAYRTEIVRAIGGFDPMLIRGEDVVLGTQVLERGPIVFAPDAVVVHPPRPKEWANRRAWRTLLESEIHFKRTYPAYAPARSQTLSLQKPEHVFSRWVILPVRRYWRWHWAYLRRAPLAYLRHIPLIIGEKLALFSLLPFFIASWRGRRQSRGGHDRFEVSAQPPTEGVGLQESGPISAVRTLSVPSSPTQGRQPAISVVVPTRNRASLLPRLLAALEAQEYPDFEVVMVDDGSSDDTATILNEWVVPNHVWLRIDPSESAGSYAARNAGWRRSRGEIVAFTDDDCLPEPGWLAALARALDAGDAIGVQGVTLPSPGEITPFTHQIEQTEPGPPYRTCNIAYRRAILETIGGFDDRLRWYADNLFGLEARQLGPMAFAADAIVHHPPRPKEWRDSATWLARFRTDAIHRQRLQELGLEPRLPSRLLPVMLWVLRPLLKQSWAHLRNFVRHPIRYLGQLPPMVIEKRELYRALRQYWQSPDQQSSDRTSASDLPPLAAEPAISVVIVTRGGSPHLDGALSALDRQTRKPQEVIAVWHSDREPPDAERAGVRVIHAPSCTLGAARQLGLEAARGDIIAFTDDDCLPDPGWIESVVQAFQRRPALWGVQGRTLAERGPIGSHAVRVTHADPLFQTCNIAYRRAALDRAGGFDTRFGGWFEDTALGARVLRAGSIGWAPAMLVTHRAVPRRSYDRHTWSTLLHDERLLAREYPAFYRRTRGPGFYTAVILRWALGSPLKTVLRASPRAKDDPGAYLRLIRDLTRERRELFAAIVNDLL